MVDAAVNSQGMKLLRRDVMNVTTWFNRKGLKTDSEELYAELVTQMWT